MGYLARGLKKIKFLNLFS